MNQNQITSNSLLNKFKFSRLDKFAMASGNSKEKNLNN